MGTMDDQVGRNVKQIRDALGMSQAEVAKGMTDDGCAGFYPQTILKVEKGTRSLKFTEADSLARVLRVPMVNLLYPDDPAASDLVEILKMHSRIGTLIQTIKNAREQLERHRRLVLHLESERTGCEAEANRAISAYVESYPDVEPADLIDQLGLALGVEGGPVNAMIDAAVRDTLEKRRGAGRG